MERVSYKWTLEQADFTKDKGKVFSCFSGGGGSTMGYKLAGFDVIGCNEIDKRMMSVYLKNHNPKYSYLEGIQTLKSREDLPIDLFDLDILDGSPPCSSFSMSGNRGKDWGKEKVFREGQSKQVLDTLFFDFIDLAKKLQPKIVVAENVMGLLQGGAIKYVAEIYKQFESAGYYLQHFILDAATMGVPQRRQRVFFIGLRNDLAGQFLTQTDLFFEQPQLNLEFNGKPIPFAEIEDKTDTSTITHTAYSKYWALVKEGESFDKVHPKGHFFSDNKADPAKPIPTILADNHGTWHYSVQRRLNDSELIKAASFPSDYNFCGQDVKYIVGMSVPPLMIYGIATQLYRQWICKFT